MPNETRDPWFKQFSRDQLGDLRLRLCSLAGRGLYHEGRNVMHSQGQPYGHLALVADLPLDAASLSKLIGAPAAEIQAALDEVQKSGLWEISTGGVLFDADLITRRLKVEKGRTFGSRGGNPALTHRLTHPLTVGLTHPLTPLPTNDLPEAGLTVGLTPTLNPPLARAHLALALSSSEGGSGGELPPHIPTPAEFRARFMVDGIPAEYLDSQFAWFEGNNSWLDKNGGLKSFPVIVRDRWKRDRQKWHPSTRPDSAREDPEDLRVALQGETDADKRAALLARLKAATHKP